MIRSQSTPATSRRWPRSPWPCWSCSPRWERTFARERAAHARAVALSSGKPPGRPGKLDNHKLQAARASLAAGMHPDDVADTLNIHRATLYRALQRDQATS